CSLIAWRGRGDKWRAQGLGSIMLHVGSKNPASWVPTSSQSRKSGGDATGLSGWKRNRRYSDPLVARTAAERRSPSGNTTASAAAEWLLPSITSACSSHVTGRPAAAAIFEEGTPR